VKKRISLRRMALGALSIALVSSYVAVPGAGAGAAKGAHCAPAASPGGDWPAFGHDLRNSRFQPAEKKITPSTATLLMPKWTFGISNAGGVGNFQSTPIVADGCLYVGTNQGWVFALNADTGAVVWKTNLASSDLLAGLSGGIFSLAVGNGRVYANVSATDRPYADALDQATGKVLWKAVVATGGGAYTNSSPALIHGMLFIGISGPEDGPTKGRHPGGYALLDEKTGRLIKRVYTVTTAENARGFKGVSLWGTPVFDAETGYAYDGTGQPASKNKEARLSNSIIKIDLRRGAGLGDIVDSYHGDYDEGQDLDFGGSPNMWTDAKGRTVGGDLQKSGRYHAVYADTMSQAWWARLADPLALGDAGTGAVDGKAVYVAGSSQTAAKAEEPNPGYLYSFNKTTGAQNWRTPIASGVDYHLVSAAGGVVYVITTTGVVLGLDASNGLPVFVRSLSADAADGCANLSSGAIVARNRVYAVCDVGGAGGGWIVSYGL